MPLVEDNALAMLATKVAKALLEELKLDGVVIKLHLGNDSASCGITSKSRAHRVLDDIVLGEIEAMTSYCIDVHGAREMGGLIDLPREDGGRDVVRTGERNSETKDGAS